MNDDVWLSVVVLQELVCVMLCQRPRRNARMSERAALGANERDWSASIFDVLSKYSVRQVGYVPDGGHARLIERVHRDKAMRPITLTTEEEGVALAVGAWIGGHRSVLLMQSSGVGNCVNMLSLINICRIPFLTIVAMRGEWGEVNPWQVPMASAVEGVFGMMGIHVLRAESDSDVASVMEAAAAMVFNGGASIAALLSQRLIGAKAF